MLIKTGKHLSGLVLRTSIELLAKVHDVQILWNPMQDRSEVLGLQIRLLPVISDNL